LIFVPVSNCAVLLSNYYGLGGDRVRDIFELMEDYLIDQEDGM
jgi:hypothetical protein